MNKRFYHFANFFLMLTVAANVFQSSIGLLLGPGIVSLESFPIWFLVLNAVMLATGIYLLKYFHYRKYSLTFSAGTIAIIASLCHATVVYILVVSGELKEYFMATLLFSLGAGMVYALSLIFSGAGERLAMIAIVPTEKASEYFL